MTGINTSRYNCAYFSIVFIIETHIVTRVKNLLKEGVPPEQITMKLKNITVPEIYQIIEQYKPARRWALHYFPDLKINHTPLLGEYCKPNFGYLLEIYKNLRGRRCKT